MAGPGILARSEIRLMIRNSYLADSTNRDIDVVNLIPISAFEGISASRGTPKSGVMSGFEPRGISINGAEGEGGGLEVDRDATHAFISGREKNDPTWNNMEERFACGVMHPNSFKFIRCRGTTARGIIIHG